ncbi:MAG TPA: SIS domain-containing protein [Pseudonocardiaceae bacterium]|jgi:D-sedoheptulose 7-phosphate isomerase|nr:SIS domain-containing protein [Pseudonocardiaceae bacterium]
MIATLTGAQVDRAFARRIEPTKALGQDAEAVARACYDMALRFHRGGRLLCFGNGSAAADAAHIVVEFVHPVIVGKRALPAVSLANDAATWSGIARLAGVEDSFAAQLRLLGMADDIALGISADGQCANVARALEVARDAGLLTVALVGGQSDQGGKIARIPRLDHVLVARSDDPRVVKEIHVTAYHVLWELVHVFFEQPGVLSPRVVG